MISVDIESALRLSADLGDGPTREAELLWLAFEASRHKKILELGSWIGASTRALAMNTPGTVLAIDTWDGGKDEYIRGRLREQGIDYAYNAFLENTKDLNNLTLFRHDSVGAAELFRSHGARFDMIFVDGSHDYESVKRDIHAWSYALLPGGLICGDDYDQQVFPGVFEAVNELIRPVSKIAGTVWANVPGKYKT